mmetsp:Transcript_16782/g.42882  ORF Transcript_16782/g.42882 Transcript_16782/m.42882 type:complete len:97 (+) Transcript_16782:16-306(+)
MAAAGAAGAAGPQLRSTLGLYRECLRIAQDMKKAYGAGQASFFRENVRKSFRANRTELDPKRIEEQRQQAASAIDNYILVQVQRLAVESKSKPTSS